MFLFEPERTDFDLKWRMFGIHVRVHPMFWLVSIAMGYRLIDEGVQYLLIWIVCMFVSILVHELGHVAAYRFFHTPAHIVLFGFGGLAIGQYPLRTPGQRILVSLAGPVAGLIFMLPSLALVRGWIPGLEVHQAPYWVQKTLEFLLWMNLVWNILNLVPIWPLDGGQISREALKTFFSRKGEHFALGLSLVLAGLLALHCLMVHFEQPFIPFLGWFGGIFPAILFGLLAFTSFEELQKLQGRSRWEDDRWH